MVGSVNDIYMFVLATATHLYVYKCIDIYIYLHICPVFKEIQGMKASQMLETALDSGALYMYTRTLILGCSMVVIFCLYIYKYRRTRNCRHIRIRR